MDVEHVADIGVVNFDLRVPNGVANTIKLDRRQLLLGSFAWSQQWMSA